MRWILLLIFAALLSGFSGCAINPSAQLPNQPVRIVMMCGGEGVGQGVLLSPDTLLITSHQLRDRKGALHSDGFMYVGGEEVRFQVTEWSPTSQATILRIEPSIEFSSFARAERLLPLTAGQRAYLVCYKPPLQSESYADVLRQCGELYVVPGTIEDAVELPTDPGGPSFVPDKGFEWVKLAPGLSGAPVYIIDSKTGPVIIGVNSTSVPVTEEWPDGRKTKSRVKLIAR